MWLKLREAVLVRKETQGKENNFRSLLYAKGIENRIRFLRSVQPCEHENR